jgi:hypothetical protein
MFLDEGFTQMESRVFVQAAKDLGIHAGDPFRGVTQAFPIRVLSDGEQNLPHRFANALVIHRQGSFLPDAGEQSSTPN